jgi:hypothetical protein
MAAGAGKGITKLANAFVPDADLSDRARRLSAASTKLVLKIFKKKMGGLWVGGAVTLTPDALVFSPNAINRAMHDNVDATTLPLARVTDVRDRFGWVTHIVDVTLDDGSMFTFRCFGAKAFANKVEAAAQAQRSA